MVLIYKKVYECGFDMIQEDVTFLGVVSIISFRKHLEMDEALMMYLHHTQILV